VLSSGAVVELAIERPVAGGRMLARHAGQVVFVAGAIPGERVRARIERVNRHAAWAQVVDVLDASTDRRTPAYDPACGGAFYAYIDYQRQRAIKADIIVDALRRIGRIELTEPVPVAASPERGYRLRARLHVRGRRAGFFREGSHLLCDASATGQLHPDALPAVDALLRVIDRRAPECEDLIISENIRATSRVVHLEPRQGARLDDLRVSLDELSGISGVTTDGRSETVTVAGEPSVLDTAEAVFGTDSPVDPSVVWRRRASSFFQANRFLLGSLVRRVLDAIDAESCLDLYSGVGLFAVALASTGRRVVAVEGDRASGADLLINAVPWRERLSVRTVAVERFTRQPLADRSVGAVIVDPPRTGVSAEALEGLARWSVPRIVYVSCDPPTLARDAARLAIAGYRLMSIDAFDLFPNTPHVEAVAVFQRPST
jgi:23S rRNA (uracil1939-C5)-methyltransferase